MARPRKKGLDYFPVDVDLFDDEKIFELNNEFGPLGEAVYLRILCLIYRNGYYYRYQSMDRLASMILKSIGGRWCQSKEKIQQVIRFLAECNLLSSELMQENVMTSAGIQRRYLNVARRRSETIEEYNLLGNDEGLFDVQEKNVSDAETRVSAAITGVCADKKYTKQSKVKQSKVKQSKAEESKAPAGTAAAASPRDETNTLLALMRENICPVNYKIERDLDDWLQHMEPACVEYAIREAALSGARTPKYVYAILQRMLDEGVTRAGQLTEQRGKKKERLAFESDNSDYAHYFDGENMYGGGLL